MIKVRVLYPNAPGVRFDHDYYRERHMPMVLRLLGDACKGHTIDRGLAGGAPGAPAPYVAACSLAFESVASFQAAFGAHVKAIMGDIPNYTDAQPVTQISEVVAL